MNSHELRGPLHLFRCFIELGKMALDENRKAFFNMLDDAEAVWGDGDD